MSNGLDPDQARQKLIWVQTVSKGYHTMTLVVEILTVVFDSHVLFTSSDCLKFSFNFDAVDHKRSEIRNYNGDSFGDL